MQSQTPNNEDPQLIRWLSLASAAGAAVASAISLWLKQSIWLNVSIIASLLAVAFIAAWWNRSRIRADSRNVTQQQTLQHIQEVTDLRSELEKHKNFEMELKRSKLAAESAAMAKSEFLATMSHEIRTPLNGIIPMLDLLASSKLAADQEDILNTARSSAKQMKQIVDDILDYSKLEANKLKLETTGLNIREVVNSVLQMFNSQAEAKRISLNMSLDPSLRLALRGDPVRLRQVLSNLFSNAIKFTNKGSVTIAVKPKSESRQHHVLRFEVRDTGIGISPEDAGRLFRPFSQADASTTRLYGGTGLGLVISKRIIDLMGGQIGVESQPGHGSTFWFEIPMLKAVGDSQGMASDMKNATVLLFTSDPILSTRFEKANSVAGARINLASTAFQVQKILKDSIAVGGMTDIDLLIIDVNSGRQGAIQMQKTLLANPDFERLRIAMLHNPEAVPLDLAKHPRRWSILRNMDMSLIIAEINRLLSSSSFNARTRQKEESEPQVSIQPADLLSVSGQSRGNVLLVEDNPVNLLVAQRLLQLSNFDCVSAENGEIALELMQQQKFDLVLMDCQMPVLDGYQATRAWRNLEAERGLPRLPIIAMTANAMAEDRQKCLDAGMDDYLSKPVDRKLLQQTMINWIAKAQSSTHTIPVTPTQLTPMVNSESKQLRGKAGDGPALDSEVIEELQEIMGTDTQTLIRIYLEDSPLLLAQLQEAYLQRDSTAAIAPVHTLKSSSANLGAIQLSKIALSIETEARAGSIEKAALEMKDLLAEFGRVKDELGKLMD
jgi:signal transduction histidine kinase/CheY-like chemotaxis protein/HPt (histidine-containing phosphotransfer) domain-containing protein